MEVNQRPPRIKILSYHNVIVPSKSARSLNAIWTSVDLSRIGEVFCYVNKGTEKLDFKTLYGVNISDYPSFHLKLTKFKNKGFSGIEKRINILKDIITSENSKIITYVSQARPLRYLLFLKKLGFKTKIVLEVHSEKEPWDNTALKGVNGIIFTSKSLMDHFTKRYSIPYEIQKRVFYHRIRKPLVREIHNPIIDKHNYHIGYIGGLELWKGVDTIVEAMRYLPNNVKALFIGGKEGSTDYIRLLSKAKDLGVANRVQFKGYVPYEVLEESISEIDVFILPLRDHIEGSIPLKLFDYMYFGKPIVTSNQESIKEILEDGISTLFFSPGSERDLADQVKKLIENPSLGHKLAINANRLIGSYTVDKWLEEMEVFLEKI